MNLPRLETERLILRKIEYSDRFDIYEYAKNPEVAKYVLWEAHKSEIDTIAFLNLIYEGYNKNEPAPWGIELKENSKIIGTVGFVNLNKENNSGEIGFVLAQKFWNKGFVSEAVKKIIQFGFEEMKLHKIIARCKLENISSEKVLLKSGFIFIGILKDNLFIKGELCDMKLFEIYNSLLF
ncbi:MAG: GNAT family N-acetyltransferase [Ignavibacteriae bacterium]|nr:GNAT family N-acetyltransferase [Ignavibacteriota bacterium]